MPDQEGSLSQVVAGMPSIDVGIYVEGEMERLDDTLRALRKMAAPSIRTTVLLGQMGAAFRCAERVVPIRGGCATALNTLLRISTSPAVVLIENGARPASDAIYRMLCELREDVAIVGPSTNLAWNEQRQLRAPGPPAGDDDIERFARWLATRFPAASRELKPLHSLADFCYVVQRDMVLQLGGADEAYDPGPCWEMDLNIRADRAGYRTLWVPSAYVHRPPISNRRREREQTLLPVAKRLYQDRFCGARLRGETEYRDHCRGDACPDFAPHGLMKPVVRPASSVVEGNARGFYVARPLVSCILPTTDRPRFVVEAVRNFLAQDYPNKELVVVDDGDASVGPMLPEDDRIVYVRLRARLSLGEKRNVACAHAQGGIIAHFDDDDWYPTCRLTTQVRALVERGAEIAGTSQLYFLELCEGGEAWLYSRPGVGWVAGSTLIYRRQYWDANRFASISVGEDTRFLANAKRGAVNDLKDARLCVAMIHARNTSPKKPAAPYWQAIATERIRDLLGERLDRYRGAADFAGAPLVSCVMPTFNRPAFVALAVECFEAQSYPNKELIVLDDGSVPVGAITQDHNAVNYYRLNRIASIGEKRNLGNTVARGEIICLWDDDDWYSGERIQYQMVPLLYDEADITGLVSAYWLDLPTGESWCVTDDLHHAMFEGNVAGGTLAYRRAVSRRIRFPNASLAEDAWFLRQAVSLGFRLKSLANQGRFIYMRHDKNTWRFALGGFLEPNGWKRTNPPVAFDSCRLSAYQAAGRMTVGVKGGKSPSNDGR